MDRHALAPRGASHHRDRGGERLPRHRRRRVRLRRFGTTAGRPRRRPPAGVRHAATRAQRAHQPDEREPARVRGPQDRAGCPGDGRGARSVVRRARGSHPGSRPERFRSRRRGGSVGRDLGRENPREDGSLRPGGGYEGGRRRGRRHAQRGDVRACQRERGRPGGLRRASRARGGRGRSGGAKAEERQGRDPRRPKGTKRRRAAGSSPRFGRVARGDLRSERRRRVGVG
mmetsp:Transcript_9852/g.42932  ORF Transcript_9852/g.42932 Transcript_9852/m.42932 type:complete len:229 (+) Transcript_9852:2202-2888(+)